MNRVLINKALFSHKYLKNIILRLQNDIKTQGDLKTEAFERLHAASYLCVFIYGKFIARGVRRRIYEARSAGSNPV